MSTYGVFEQQDLSLPYVVAEMDLLMGSNGALADAFARHFVLPEPARLNLGGGWTLRSATVACAHASGELAVACIARLRELNSRGRFHSQTPESQALLDGAQHYVNGQYGQAAKSFRPLNSMASLWDLAGFALVIVPAFDAADESELAEAIDRRVIALGGPFNGVGMAEVRSARRAMRKGDRDRAARLARKVVHALEGADVRLPVVEEMRRLADRASPASPRGASSSRP
jgi:hypothetical protein